MLLQLWDLQICIISFRMPAHVVYLSLVNNIWSSSHDARKRQPRSIVQYKYFRCVILQYPNVFALFLFSMFLCCAWQHAWKKKKIRVLHVISLPWREDLNTNCECRFVIADWTKVFALQVFFVSSKFPFLVKHACCTEYPLLGFAPWCEWRETYHLPVAAENCITGDFYEECPICSSICDDELTCDCGGGGVSNLDLTDCETNVVVEFETNIYCANYTGTSCLAELICYGLPWILRCVVNSYQPDLL